MDPNFNNELNEFNQGLFDYVPLENGIFQDDFDDDYILGNNEENNEMIILQRNHRRANKIENKAGFATFRLLILYCLYLCTPNPLTEFISNLILFLLVHEFLVISNCIGMRIYLGIKHRYNPHNIEFPSLCLLIDSLNTLFFFTWFLYGNYEILFDKNGVEESLQKNILVTYYITILILFGFFIFAKIIFYLVFIIIFCPCISYVLFSDIREEYKQAQKAKKLQEQLIDISYEDYLKKNGSEADMCIICTDSFKNNDRVIELSCNNKHVFHADCIKTWIAKKTICPMCRADLVPDLDEENDNNINEQ